MDSRLLLLLLILIPIIAIFLPWIIEIFGQSYSFEFRRRWHSRLTAFITGLSFIASILIIIYGSIQAPIIVDMPIWEPHFLLFVDGLSLYFILMINIIVFVASLYLDDYISYLYLNKKQSDQHKPRTLHFFFHVFHLTMLLVVVVDNLYLLWLSLSLTTISSIVLVGYRRDENAIEATENYIFITSVGLAIALIGTLFLQNAVTATIPTPDAVEENTLTMNWSELIELANSEANPNSFATKDQEIFIKFSFVLILIGYGIKAGLAPGHPWLPDGHGEAPFPVSALLSGVLVKTAFYAILRFYSVTNLTLRDQGAFANSLLIGAGIFSLVLAVPFIRSNRYTKRILAFHTLSHMGITAFGIGVATPVAYFGAILHMLFHALTKTLLFQAHGLRSYSRYAPDSTLSIDKTNEETAEKPKPSFSFLETVMGLAGLGLVGAPLFGIFVSEFLIMLASIKAIVIDSKLSLVVPVLLFFTANYIIFTGLVKHLRELLYGRKQVVYNRGEALELPAEKVKIGILQAIPLLTLLALIILLGLTVFKIQALDLVQLLNQIVSIVTCGSKLCLNN